MEPWWSSLSDDELKTRLQSRISSSSIGWEDGFREQVDNVVAHRDDADLQEKITEILGDE